MAEAHNIDDLLNSKLTPAPVTIAPAVEEKAESEVESGETEEKLTFVEQFRKDKEEILGKSEEESAPDEPEQETEAKETSKLEKVSKEKAEEVDEYGTEIPKERTYSESEVQRMIQDRLSRGRHIEPPAQPVSQKMEAAQADGFEVDPNSEVKWEDQLNNFIDRRLEAKEAKRQEAQWKSIEQKKQAEFESKFATGVNKYNDFAEVVGDKPITNAIMMAARGMKDPAAFLYAAAKQQPKELERIAAINDPYQVAVEVGRLESNMRKSRGTSQAPKPIARTKGDIPSSKGDVKLSLDQLIALDAKRKLGRR